MKVTIEGNPKEIAALVLERQERQDLGSPLTGIKTCDLVSELANREGVKAVRVEPNARHALTVEGPVIVLTVID